MGKRVGIAWTVVAVALGAAGCATAGSAGAPAASTPAGDPAVEADSSSFIDDLRVLDLSSVASWVELESPDALARTAEVVVKGRVAAWRAGTIARYDYGGLAYATMVLEISEAVVLKESDSPGRAENQSFFVVMIGSEEIAAALPVGMPVVAYLSNPSSSPDRSEVEGLRLENSGGGRPEGELVWAVDPQGFVVEVGPGELYWPLMDESLNADLVDVLPGGDVLATSH